MKRTILAVAVALASSSALASSYITLKSGVPVSITLAQGVGITYANILAYPIPRFGPTCSRLIVQPQSVPLRVYETLYVNLQSTSVWSNPRLTSVLYVRPGASTYAC